MVLRIVAHKDGTPVVSGGFGCRELAPRDRERRSSRLYDPLAFASSDSQGSVALDNSGLIFSATLSL